MNIFILLQAVLFKIGNISHFMLLSSILIYYTSPENTKYACTILLFHKNYFLMMRTKIINNTWPE